MVAQPIIRGYTIVDRLGSGGFASVYLATKDETDLQFAIKVLHDHASNPDDVRRFERERTTMRALSGHPNIVGVFDDGQTEDGSHYTVLEYVGEGSVRDRIDEGGALHWANVVEIGVQICAALDVAHRSGVLHRDVKPANILLQDTTAKLSDFGIARLVGQSQVTAAQSIIGTLAYTPPEIFHNDPFDGRGDIYQLGISLYEMLLGRAPFTSAAADNKATIIRRILDNPAPPLAQFDIPQPLSDLLDEVLAKDPADRPQSAETFGRRLNSVEATLGRTPTHVGEETQSIALETATISTGEGLSPDVAPSSLWGPNSNDEQQARIDPTIASSGAPAAPIVSVPEAPNVSPSIDANVTVAEQRPTRTTSVISSTPPPSLNIGTESVRPSNYDALSVVDPAPGEEHPRWRRRWLWVAALLLAIGAAGAGVGVAQLVDDGDIGDPGVTTADLNDDDGAEDREPEFAVLEHPAFAAPLGSVGVIFDSVANSGGLTMVGAAGDGEGANQQNGVVWTLGWEDLAKAATEGPTIRVVDGSADSRGRLWSVGVIDGEEFLVAGETSGNGISWIGAHPRDFERSIDSSFTGAAADSLRAVAADSETSFLVAGKRTKDSAEVMGLWQVTEGASWASPQWESFDVDSGAPGVLNDLAVVDDFAVAVGREEVDGIDHGVMLIRRDDAWAHLLRPWDGAEFHSVTIADNRIVAVGQLGSGESETPFAIVTNPLGDEGWFHLLPVSADRPGIARSVITLEDGRVISVGTVVGEVADDRDGAIWELISADILESDQWTTRATPDLRTDGFTELWTIDEFNDIVYVFGRTEIGDRRPAGAWTLDLADSS
ncbi:MAG: serine/threonine protein kinase [Verrucomicrobiales bacterium]|jgi:serine/threonine protein kinase